MIDYNDFSKLDIRAGEIKAAEINAKAKKPSYKIWVDFGEEIGLKQSSAQLTECYTPADLIGRQILGVINLSPKKIAGFNSEFLILGICTNRGVVLIQPEKPVEKGDKVF